MTTKQQAALRQHNLLTGVYPSNDDAFYQPVIHKIQQARMAQDMSRTRLAGLSGLNPQTIVSWENGEQRPTLFDLLSVCHVLGLDVFSLFPDLESWHPYAPY
jgi:DNA-binding XRE family transcriptional regulator